MARVVLALIDVVVTQQGLSFKWRNVGLVNILISWVVSVNGLAQELPNLLVWVRILGHLLSLDPSG